MLNWLKRKNREPEDEGPDTDVRLANADAQIKKPASKQAPVAGKTAPKHDPTLARRQSFEKIGIPYEKILKTEMKVAGGIEAEHIYSETEQLNLKLAQRGFDFQVSCLECFECKLILIDYEQARLESLRLGIKQPIHDIVSTAVIREMEKIVRQKRALTDNPASGKGLESFRSEVADLYESVCAKAAEHQLRQQAIRRIRHLRHSSANPTEADIKAMMDHIAKNRGSLAAV